MTLIIKGKRPARGYEQGVSILKKAKWMYREYMDYYRRFGGTASLVKSEDVFI